ncbi:f5 8 type c domain-containing protein [Lasius niger]|uniref:F5 8 type c domain-containing protein n=1 Tax=Lasius niger TaxID=67767 RepID=A0A0J7L4C0_LASNI|nr:f5 8 type c domain-containing protein [Lasius niger]
MSTKTPIKYEDGQHKPFDTDDTLPAGVSPVQTDASLKGDGTAGSELGVVLSGAPGNDLQFIDGELYHGSTKSGQDTWYVDAIDGDDSNSGTIDAPMQSMTAAVKAMKHIPVAYNIKFRAGQVHEWLRPQGKDMVWGPKEADIKLCTYRLDEGSAYRWNEDGSTVDPVVRNSCPDYNPIYAADISRAELHMPLWVVNYPDGATIAHIGLASRNCDVYACVMHWDRSSLTEDKDSNRYPTIGTFDHSYLSLHGCQLKFTASSTNHVFNAVRANATNIEGTQFLTEVDGVWYDSRTATTAEPDILLNAYTGNSDGCPNVDGAVSYPPLVTSIDDMSSHLTYDKLGAAYVDTDRHIAWGVATNFDPFADS